MSEYRCSVCHNSLNPIFYFLCTKCNSLVDKVDTTRQTGECLRCKQVRVNTGKWCSSGDYFNLMPWQAYYDAAPAPALAPAPSPRKTKEMEIQEMKDHEIALALAAAEERAFNAEKLEARRKTKEMEIQEMKDHKMALALAAEERAFNPERLEDVEAKRLRQHEDAERRLMQKEQHTDLLEQPSIHTSPHYYRHTPSFFSKPQQPPIVPWIIELTNSISVAQKNREIIALKRDLVVKICQIPLESLTNEKENIYCLCDAFSELLTIVHNPLNWDFLFSSGILEFCYRIMCFTPLPETITQLVIPRVADFLFNWCKCTTDVQDFSIVKRVLLSSIVFNK